MAKEPRIVDGMRSPSELEQLVREGRDDSPRRAPSPAPPPKPAPKPDFPTVFQSEAVDLLVSVNIRTDLPDGSYKNNRFFVRFRNNIVDITKEKYPFNPKVVSETLRSLPGYGLGMAFWDADEAQRQADAAEREAVIERVRAVKGDPELVAALKQTLAEDFEVSKPSPDAR